MSMEEKILIRGTGLRQWFPVKRSFWEQKLFVKAVDGVDITVHEGETFGIAGESGCGKSTLLRTLLRVVEPTAGTIEFAGRDITHLPNRQLRPLRRDMQMVFQDPYSSLDGNMRVGAIIEEPMVINKLYDSHEERQRRVKELMVKVGLDDSYVDRYPHEFSGGQRQRIVIARALATIPKLVLCDEAVSALDVSVRAQVLNLMDRLKQEMHLTYIFVSHDMSVLEHICDRLMIMYMGRVMEVGTKDQIFNHCSRVTSPAPCIRRRAAVSARAARMQRTSAPRSSRSSIWETGTRRRATCARMPDAPEGRLWTRL